MIVEERNFADKLKKIIFILTGKDSYTQEQKSIYLEEWGMTVGEMLQKVGTDLFRNNFDKDTWIKATLSTNEQIDVVLLGDCRFTNEAENIKKKDGILIRLEGDPADVRKNSVRDINHISETSLDNYQGFDYIYNNEGSIEKFESFAEYLTKEIVLKLVKNFNIK